MNFVNLCDDIIEMVSNEVKNHPRYKFRNTLKDINYYGGNYEAREPMADYEKIMINLWNRRCQWCNECFTRLPCYISMYKDKKQRLLNYWEMRFIHEVNDGYGLSRYQKIENEQQQWCHDVFEKANSGRLFYMNPERFEKNGHYIQLEYREKGITYRLVEDSSESSDER